MSETIDIKLLRIERTVLDSDFVGKPAGAFCLRSVWDAQPESADAAEARRRLLASISPENDYSGYKCPVEGCIVSNYPTQPSSRRAIEEGGKTWTPLSPKDSCPMAGFCLQNDWELVKSTTSVKVGRAMCSAIREECSVLAGGTFLGGQYCPNPECDLSAGLSEDQIAGTDGECGMPALKNTAR